MAMLRVKTKYGEIEGIPGWNQAVSMFRGIPYAAPPVGENRWREPQPLTPWEGVLQAYNFRNISWQERRPSEGNGTLVGDEFYCVDWPRSEDCLYLNVWTPARSPEENLPVVVYLHGGGHTQGYGYLNCYDGEGFCKRGCIYVSLNHRLGVFGYMAHPELTAESAHHTSGNYGELDIIAALQWIHENIAAFGGDPRKVTIMGQSGGGDKVAATLCSPLSKGLISGAIMQSGGGINPTFGERTLAEEEKRGIAVLEALGAADIAEARKADPEQLLEAVRKCTGPNPFAALGWFAPNGDGYVLPEYFLTMFRKGGYPDLPVMIGCTAEEGLDNRYADPAFPLPDRAAAAAQGEELLGAGMGETFLSAIRYDTDPDYAREMYRKYIGMNGASLAGVMAFCANHLKKGKTPAYQYFFSLVPPGAANAHHSAEHHYIFQTLVRSARPYTGRDWDLSNTLADYWANFVKTGDPNGPGLPAWTPHTAESPRTLNICYEPAMIDEPSNAYIDLLAESFLQGASEN